MNDLSFASLGSSAFAVVVRKRQALVAARNTVVALIDADPCDRRCTCSGRPAYDAAIKAEAAAYAEVREADASWAEFCAIRKADSATVAS